MRGRLYYDMRRILVNLKWIHGVWKIKYSAHPHHYHENVITFIIIPGRVTLEAMHHTWDINQQ